MRTFSTLAVSVAALFSLYAPAAFAEPSQVAPLGLKPVTFFQSVSLAVNSQMDELQAEFERWDDEARYQRILSRRGTAGPKRVAPRKEVASEPAWESPELVETVTEESVSYGNYHGTASPLIVETVLQFNQQISQAKAGQLAALIEVTADRYGVDPLLVTALVSQESAFYQSAVSPVGATGLGQLMPETAQDLGVNPHDAVENLDGSVRYLADLLYTWSGSEDPTALALASYNAGAGNVEHYGGIPPFEETQNYVVVIKERYALLSSGQTVYGG